MFMHFMHLMTIITLVHHLMFHLLHVLFLAGHHGTGSRLIMMRHDRHELGDDPIVESGLNR